MCIVLYHLPFRSRDEYGACEEVLTTGLVHLEEVSKGILQASKYKEFLIHSSEKIFGLFCTIHVGKLVKRLNAADQILCYNMQSCRGNSRNGEECQAGTSSLLTIE